MKSKYNTGDPIDIKKIPKEELKIAFHEWAEGSIALEELLNEGYKRGFLSFASCAGDGGVPYIMYELDNDNSRKMAMSLAKQLVDSDFDCEISFFHDFYKTEEEYRKMREHLIKNFPDDFSEENLSPVRSITQLKVGATIENGEEVFRFMARHIKEAKLDKVKLPESEKEIPCKNYKEKERTTNQSTKGTSIIDKTVEESKNDIRQGEIEEAIVEIKQAQKEHIEEQTNPKRFTENEHSIGG